MHRFVSDPGVELYAEPFASKARLVLHFDVNKSILITDKAQDSDSTAVVNMLLSECAWGRLEPGPRWVPVGRLATDRLNFCPHLLLDMIYQRYLTNVHGRAYYENCPALHCGHMLHKLMPFGTHT